MAGATSLPRMSGAARSGGPTPLVWRAPVAAPPRAALPGLLGWLAAGVVAGLFAMHGLGVHGVHSGGTLSAMHAEGSPPASAMSAGGHGSGPEALAAYVDPGVASAGSPADGTPRPVDDPGLLGLCLTLLVLGVLGLRRRSGLRPAWILPHHALRPRPPTLPVTARDLSPPSRAELSVWRC